MDVKTAYLNSPIDHEIYMEQPERYEKEGPNGVQNENVIVWSEIKWT